MTRKPTDPRAFLPGANVEALVADQGAADRAREKIEGDEVLREAVQGFHAEGTLPPYLPEAGAKVAMQGIVPPVSIALPRAEGIAAGSTISGVQAPGLVPRAEEFDAGSTTPGVQAPGLLPRAAEITSGSTIPGLQALRLQPRAETIDVDPLEMRSAALASTALAPVSGLASPAPDLAGPQLAAPVLESLVILAPEVFTPPVQVPKPGLPEDVLIGLEPAPRGHAALNTDKMLKRPPGATQFGLEMQAASGPQASEAPTELPSSLDVVEPVREPPRRRWLVPVVALTIIGMGFFVVSKLVSTASSGDAATSSAPRLLATSGTQETSLTRETNQPSRRMAEAPPQPSATPTNVQSASSEVPTVPRAPSALPKAPTPTHSASASQVPSSAPAPSESTSFTPKWIKP